MPSPTPTVTSYGAPPPYTNNAALIALWPTIAAAAASTKPPVSANFMYAQAIAEGGINSDGTLNTSPKGAIGVFQLEPGTATTLGVKDPTDNTQNIYGAAQYDSQLLRAYGGNYSLVASGYNAGPGNVQDFMNGTNVHGNNPQLLITGGVPTIPETQKYLAKIANTGAITASGTAVQDELKRTASPYKALVGQPIDDSVYKSLFPDIVVTEGLDAPPWFSDPSLITGNPRLRKEVQPVTFKIFLGDHISNFALASQGRTGKPIEIQLNASMKNYSVSQKHLFNQQRTRTAFHITMWGMQADMIEGSCTTGVFMNQLGLTDYFSTFSVDEHLKELIGGEGGIFLGSAGSTSNTTPQNPTSSAQAGVLGSNGNQGGVEQQQIFMGADGYDSTMQALARSNPNFKEANAMRVAAQDAFQEFLALFKMNGMVWLYSQPYQTSPSESPTHSGTPTPSNVRDWTGIQAWSPELGINSTQINARNNDVVTRGTVVMQFRNFCYEGYFKTLQWQMDAANPYKWDFSFTFQVERTIGREYVPGT